MTSKETVRKFQFIREIASGGFGSVYLAKVIHGDGFSRLCAIKLLHRKWSENDEIASRMRDEARLLGWLRHRNIVDVMDLTLIDGRCAVLMEYLEAVDVRTIIEETLAVGERVPLRVALEVCASVASALDAAYNRPPYAGEKPLHVIHRDIKPSNIMVDELGVVKVLDFGVARAEFDAREAKTAELSFGSLEYMPPERLFFEPESPASDVYSLGTTLYELLAQEKLGKAKLRQSEQERFLDERFDDLLEKHPMEPQEVEDILGELLRDMLAFDETDRPTSAECVQRMRSFGRELEQPPIEEWAESHIGRFIEVTRARESGDGATLVGRVLTEDVTGFIDDTTQQLGDDTGPTPRSAMLNKLDEQPQESLSDYDTGHDDARWSALKQATLASLSETGELSPQTVEEARRAGLIDDITVPDDPTDPDDEAMPTVRIHAPRRIAEFESTTGRLDESLMPPQDLHDAETLRMDPDEGRGSPVPEARTERIPRPSVQPREVPVEDEGGGRGVVGVLVSFVLLLAVFAVLLLVVLIVVGGGVAAWMGTPSTTVPVPAPVPLPAPTEQPAPPTPTPEPMPEPPPEPTSPTPEPGAEEPLVDAAVFESRLPDTRRMRVQCDGGSGSGEAEVRVDGAELGSCTVTAIDAKRKRQTAVLEGVESRRYICFDGDDSGCR